MKLFLMTLGAVGLFTLASCSKSDNTTNPNGNAKVQMVLTDAPSLAYDALYLDIKEVSINTGTGEDTWVKYPVAPILSQPVNILDYRNGKTLAMGDPLSLPAGKIEQIRLILGDNNTIVIDGKSEKLTVPSGVVKVNLHKELAADGVYKVWVDFDAARSVKIHETGNGKYILRPVVKAFADETNGQIRGIVLPQEAGTLVYALNGADTIGSAAPEADGMYHFVGLPAGTYSLTLDAVDSTGYKDASIPNVNVSFGKVTDVGTTTLVK